MSAPPASSASRADQSSLWRTDESRFLPGAVVAERYRIIALLGKGGMGEVYRADDLTLGQQVALKFLPEVLASNPEAVARFRNEVRVARQVSHPNVCRVYDVGEIDGHLFLSMEYVDGEDLASLLRRIGRLPADKALEIGRRLCAGLAAAHEKGVLHRDLKPANVMLDGRGQVLLTDFGLAGLAGEIAGNELRSGTPAYMAPEQLEGREVTPKSDIYALGLVLYEIFTGKRPFEATSMAELVRVRSSTTPVSLTTLVRDLDPVVERVVLRCIDPEPSRRPSSALAVAAALPGGDPLAAALAAGETPSPEMVAAAGEGSGFRPRVAVPVFLGVVAAVAISCVIVIRLSALNQIHPEYSPEVLMQKARDVIQRAGYGERPADGAYGFAWDGNLIDAIQQQEKPGSRWGAVVAQTPALLRFWYRQSPYELDGMTFHDDLLTPGMVDMDDPPPILSGMTRVDLDARGQLLYFESIPPQRQEGAKGPAPVDWSPLFAAAGLDISKLKEAQPEWRFLAASDMRTAWTGTWPGTSRSPLRVEAAGLSGKPVAFALKGPWSGTDRMPPRESSAGELGSTAIVSGIALVMCVVAPLFARRNLKQGRGDRRGAFRLAFWIFIIQMALWVFRSHFVGSFTTVGMFMIALCTSVFYGVVVWTLYIALEPFVRRYWPQTIISWTTALTGRARDPVVGRDVLVGTGLGLSWVLIQRIGDLWTSGLGGHPYMSWTDMLLGFRSTIGAVLQPIPHAVSQGMIFFFLVFLGRVLLRNQWLGALACVLLFVVLNVLSNGRPLMTGTLALVLYSLGALVVLRFGLLAFGIGMFVDNVLAGMPVTTDASAWYFGPSMFVVALVLGLAGWGFFTSIAGQKLWKESLFD